MRLRTVKENVPMGTELHFYPLGDVHLGSANCDKDHFVRVLEQIDRDPWARWGGMGDYAEWIAPSDPRWSSGGIDGEVVNQGTLDRLGDVYVSTLANLLKPVIHKCWFMGKGNHESSFERHHATSLVRRILYECSVTDSLYTGWASMTRVQFRDELDHGSTIRLFASHGWQAGRLSGAKVNQLDHMMGWIPGCDIYLQGHSHDKVVKVKTHLTTNKNFTKLESHDAYGCHTGSFLKTYQTGVDGYGEHGGYPPAPIGPIRFNITPTRERVYIEAVQ